MEILERLPEGARIIARVPRLLTAPEMLEVAIAWLQELGYGDEECEGARERLEKFAVLEKQHIACQPAFVEIRGDQLILGLGVGMQVAVPLEVKEPAKLVIGRAPDDIRSRFGMPIPMDIRFASGETRTVLLSAQSLPARMPVDVGGAALPPIEPSAPAPPQFARSIEVAEEDLLAETPEIDEAPAPAPEAPKAKVVVKKTAKGAKK